MNDSAVIYALVDPRISDKVKRVRYIGKSRSISHRLSEHRYQAKKGTNTYLYHWFNKLLKEGVEPVLVVLRHVKKSWSANWEKAYIQTYTTWGAKLVNLTDGGDGTFGHVMSEETKAKISEANKGRKFTEEQRERMGAPKKGRKFSVEHKANLSVAGTGRPVSQKTREKIREANKGFKMTPEQRAKYDAAMKKTRTNKGDEKRLTSVKAKRNRLNEMVALNPQWTEEEKKAEEHRVLGLCKD